MQVGYSATSDTYQRVFIFYFCDNYSLPAQLPESKQVVHVALDLYTKKKNMSVTEHMIMEQTCYIYVH